MKDSSYINSKFFIIWIFKNVNILTKKIQITKFCEGKYSIFTNIL
jgi:hypothetical protein